ncbi:TonB-dependent receptor [Oceanicoccus sagamiensis]|uniref:TonB-dependent receptor n=1 Tax=Oceanicoccus sagamiensis TaxID=716816 RepID=A0A1X9NR48_9GAMM|nr:TonB-dependent receptor [Oceanicoccus sagamiensis]ARN76273.1 hypothetical protein BST96_02645 [Oceanicoccus sagamiensis]
MKRMNKTLIAAAITAVISPLSANAQLEEIIVTAQKQMQNVQDVPIAISSVDNALLAKVDATVVTDLIPMIPGLTGSQYGLATNTWALRGISSNDWSIGSEPSVGVFFDGAYIGRNTFATGAFFDVNRVEVVKGPQGTLFGRNASAGAISIVSNTPEDVTTLELGVAAGDEGQRKLDVVGNWAVSDTLAFRLAYAGDRIEGQREDVSNGTEAFTDRDSVRLMTRWNPTDSLEAVLRLNYSEADSNYVSPYSTDFNTADPGEKFPDKYALTETSQPDYELARNQGAGLNLTWELDDDMEFTSITDSRTGTNQFREDLDGTAADALIDAAFFGPFGTGGANAVFDQEGEADTLYQEFRLNRWGDELDWFVGVSYYSEELDAVPGELAIDDTLFGFGTLALSRLENRADTDSYGAFIDATWHATEDLSISSGLRWSQDEKDFCSNVPVDDIEVTAPTAGAVCEDESWSEVTPRLVAQYDVGVDAMLFASVAKGYKGGGFNFSPVDSDGDGVGDSVPAFDPETSIAYELGLKSTLLDYRLQFNGSIYYTDYSDFQMQTVTGAGVLIDNAGDATTQGVELEARYNPTGSLILMATYAFLDAEFSSGDLDGNDLAFAPENTLSLGVDYEHGFLGGNLNWFAVYNYTDDYYFDGANEVDESSYGIVNARVTYTPVSESWDIAVAVDNITDEDYAVDRGIADFGLGDEQLLQGDGRLMRAEFNIRF